ncbi:MAG: response regulator [Verrucomicrobia bacterium]|jgi:lipopolysaccharide/colanic/teichoic acid biosynthesis glycosyltransferase/ActR/RegA family two-component response regulator|nr:response regulator [Verrucomicrobiota bacterium]MBT7701371.1 response regulator [Verrucomicrobiota bacterium]
MLTNQASRERRSCILKVLENSGLQSQEDDSTSQAGQRTVVLRESVAKRVLDMCVAAVLLAILSPLFLFIAIIVKRDSPGPVFYRGPRLGRGGKRFLILKFRTMHECPESYSGPRLTAQGDTRMTPLGRRLRDTKLNELPQLWNVLKGDMSLVGPRPEDPELAEALPSEVRREILSVRPGITSPASILYRDEESMLAPGKSMDTYLGTILPSKSRLDQLYVRHRSMLMDIDTLFWTALALPKALRANPAETSLFLGPIERFVRRHVSWFMIDALVTLLAVAVTGLVWRSFVVLDVGLWKAAGLAVAFALLKSVLGSLFGLHRIVWSRASGADAMDLLPALGTATAIAVVANQFWLGTQPLLPQPLIFTAAGLALGGFVVVRYRERLLHAVARRWTTRGEGLCLGQERVLIVGAGESGRVMALWLQNSTIGRAFRVVGFVDDDLYKDTMRIAGVQVLGKCDTIPALVTRYDIGIILFSIHNIHKEENSQLMTLCTQTLARVVMAPDILADLWGGLGAHDHRPDVVQTNPATAVHADIRTVPNATSIQAWKRREPNGHRMRVLIADDSSVIRERLVMQLNELAGVQVVGQAQTAAEAIHSVRRLKPDAMTLDLRLPDGNGLDVLRTIQQDRLPTAVIVLTSYPYPQYAHRARAAGAYAFLNKSADLEKVTDHLQSLMSAQRTPVTV